MAVEVEGRLGSCGDSDGGHAETPEMVRPVECGCVTEVFDLPLSYFAYLKTLCPAHARGNRNIEVV